MDAVLPHVPHRSGRELRTDGRAGQNGAVQFWKPHSLAKPHDGQLDLRTGDKVTTTVELPGIPEGTEGKVILANGFNWQRYRVLFRNGVERGDLDHRHLQPIGRAAKRLAKAAAKAS
jgi:hypothetical protein